MKQNDIEKQLDQLLANLPKQQYDTDRWLIEDHTAEFDRIVGQRRRKVWKRRLAAVAAVAVGLICIVGGVMLEPETEVSQTLVDQKTKQPTATPTEPQPEEPVLAAITPTEPKPTKPTTVKTKQVKPATLPHTAMTPIDSLTDIIAHIEASMQGVRDSCYMANVEKLIRVDDRLQRLVNDLILEGIINEEPSQVALNELQDNND